MLANEMPTTNTIASPSSSPLDSDRRDRSDRRTPSDRRATNDRRQSWPWVVDSNDRRSGFDRRDMQNRRSGIDRRNPAALPVSP